MECGLDHDEDQTWVVSILCYAFMFDGRHGVNAYIKQLKGILMWQMWMLAHVGVVSLCEYSTFMMALGNVPLRM